MKKNFTIGTKRARLAVYKEALRIYKAADKPYYIRFEDHPLQWGICSLVAEHILSPAYNNRLMKSKKWIYNGWSTPGYSGLIELEAYMKSHDRVYIAPPGEVAPRIKVLEKIINEMENGSSIKK